MKHFQFYVAPVLDRGVYKKHYKSLIKKIRAAMQSLLASGVPHTLLLNTLRNICYFGVFVDLCKLEKGLDNFRVEFVARQMGLNISQFTRADLSQVSFCSGFFIPVISPKQQYKGIPPCTPTLMLWIPLERMMNRQFCTHIEAEKYKSDFAVSYRNTMCFNYSNLPVACALLRNYHKAKPYTTHFKPQLEWRNFEMDTDFIQCAPNTYQFVADHLNVTVDWLATLENYIDECVPYNPAPDLNMDFSPMFNVLRVKHLQHDDASISRKVHEAILHGRFFGL
jgi:hypothetical protein